MLEDLINQIPAIWAVAIIVFVVCCNFFFSLGRLLYQLFIKKNEKAYIDSLEGKISEVSTLLKEANQRAMDKVDEIEKVANDATNQINLVIAHYESEVRFRKMLEDKVNNIEKQLQGNGKPSIETEIQLLKQKLDIVVDKIQSMDSGKKK